MTILTESIELVSSFSAQSPRKIDRPLADDKIDVPGPGTLVP